MSSTSEPQKTYFAFDFPYFRYIAYWPWLLWQIVKANIEIALVILNPNLPINPQIITFRKKMSNPHAHVVLANSITLTPGTVTVDVKDDLYLVHALTDSAAKGLVPEDGEAEMLTKVSSVFGEECARTGSEVSA
jgi:multicomponent Na+:H+ antiporter subunit E